MQIVKLWEDDLYNYVEYDNGTIIKTAKGVQTAGTTIQLPPTLDERVKALEDAMNVQLGL